MSRSDPRAVGPDPDEDRYRVVARHARAEVRDRGSRFIADCWPVASEGEARQQVAGVSSRHHDATHHCWAMRVGHGDASISRMQDDGEPAGTAGAPILGAIDVRGLTGTLVVVTRWFGGVKLGTSGLVRCYGSAAGDSLDEAGFEERFREAELRFRVAHADLPAAQRVVFGAGGRFAEESYGGDARLVAAVRRSRKDALRAALLEATAGRIHWEEDGA